MVKRKGAGYALEAIVAVATVFIFIYGGLEIPENQDWNDFRTQSSADDLTYALQDSGYVNHGLSEGEIGSVQEAFSTISERSVEVSGLVSNLPINENKVAFFTRPSRRFTQNLESVSGGCEGDLEEITSRSEREVLRTAGGELYNMGGHTDERLFIADLDPANASAGEGDGKQNYDSVWVDNGTDCQFDSDEGPYRVDEFIKWGDDYYDVEGLDGSNQEMSLYNSTQAVKFRDMLQRPVNGVDTFVTVDSVNYTEIDQNEYNIVVLRTEDVVVNMNNAERDILEEHLVDGSVMVLANFSSTFSDDNLMSRAGFQYVGVPYEGMYSGGPVQGRFSSSTESQDVETYFKGLNGDENSLSMSSPSVISNDEETIESTESILYSASEAYNFSKWNRGTTSMSNVDPDNIVGEPGSECYSDGTISSNLTEETLNFPDGENYDFINAELGQSDEYCSENNERAVKIDLGQDGEFNEAEDGPLLNNELVEIADRQYAVRIEFWNVSSTSTPPCYKGDCVEFVFVGDRHVELIADRNTFQDFKGNRMAVSGYRSNYGEDDLKVLVSTIHWLRGDQLSFKGRTQPEDISTSTYSGIKDKTYMPYDLNLRWSW